MTLDEKHSAYYNPSFRVIHNGVRQATWPYILSTLVKLYSGEGYTPQAKAYGKAGATIIFINDRIAK